MSAFGPWQTFAALAPTSALGPHRVLCGRNREWRGRASRRSVRRSRVLKPAGEAGDRALLEHVELEALDAAPCA